MTTYPALWRGVDILTKYSEVRTRLFSEVEVPSNLHCRINPRKASDPKRKLETVAVLKKKKKI